MEVFIMRNEISFWREDELSESQKNGLFKVNISDLLALGLEIEKLGFNKTDAVYLDVENYKNFMSAQYNLNSNISTTEKVEDISNIRNHR